MLITGTHMIGSSDHRAGKLAPKPVHIMNGVWLGARVIVLPGVTIGAGVVVGAGSLVNRDLPADTLCAGVPARVIREINLDPEQGR
jgi:maltose O-acetyltransferase